MGKKKRRRRGLLTTILIIALLGLAGVSVYFTVPEFRALFQKQKTILNGTYDNVHYYDLKYDLNNQSSSVYKESKQIMDYYNNSTSSIYVGTREIISKGSVGTIWSYPWDDNKNDNIHYFATNIHVIQEALKQPARDGDRLLIDNQNWKFKVNRNDKGELLTSGSSEKIYKTELQNVRLVTIGFKYNNPEYQSKLNVLGFNFANNLNFYSDYCILSTTTNPFGNSKDEKLEATFATAQEIDKYLLDGYTDEKGNFKRNNLYIAGFPATQSGADSIQYYHARINYQSLVSDFQDHLKYRINYVGKGLTSSSKDVAGPTFSGDPLILWKQTYESGVPYSGRPFWSYARQLLLPNANIGGGSSGSAITTVIDGKVKIVGIWWGGWSGKQNKWFSNKISFLGAANFIVSNPYMSNGYELPAYDNRVIDFRTTAWNYGPTS